MATGGIDARAAVVDLGSERKGVRLAATGARGADPLPHWPVMAHAVASGGARPLPVASRCSRTREWKGVRE